MVNLHHSFSGTLAAGDSCVAHQLRHRDRLLDECIAAGDLDDCI